jgi:EmrB/QacA subfamily drug resistance transporter
LVDQSTKNAVFLVAVMASFLTPFMASSINVALPNIQKDFHVDTMMLTWVPTSFLLSCSIFLLPLGKLADLVGRKLVFVIGISIFTVSSLSCALSPNIWMFLGSRVFQGLGTSMIFGTSMAMLATVYPPGERGKVIGINVAVVYVALSSGPFIGGILTEYFSWRGLFGAVIPLGLATVFVSFRRLNWVWRYTGEEKFDFLGSFLYGLSTLSIMMGLSTLPALKGAVLLISGCLLFYVFGKYELKLRSPVINLELFRTNRAFALSGLAALINYSATFAVTFLLSLFLQYIKGLSPKEAGLIMMAQPVTMALVAPISGRVSDHIEPGKVASLGMFITSIGLFLLASMNEITSLTRIIMNLIFLGFGFAMFSSPNMNAIMNSVDKKDYGFASGVTGSMRLFGQTLSMGLAQLVFAIFFGAVHLTPENHPVFVHSIKIAFGLFGFICAAGILPSMARGSILAKSGAGK